MVNKDDAKIKQIKFLGKRILILLNEIKDENKQEKVEHWMSDNLYMGY